MVCAAPVMLGLVPDHGAAADLAGLVGGDTHVTLRAPAPASCATAATRK